MTDLSALGLPPLHDFDWAGYFEQNEKLRHDFLTEQPLDEQTKALIFPTMRMFQLGEASDGRHLLAAAEKYVKKSGDEAYRPAVRGFITEENRHSAYLKAYMTHHGVKPSGHTPLDSIFRRLRRLYGLRGEVTVLMTAEIIALSYYSALGRCTDSAELSRICEKMLYDELRHIVFQSRTLYKLGSSRAKRVFRRLFMEVTLLAVWLPLQRVLKAGGYEFRDFRAESMGYLSQSFILEQLGRFPLGSFPPGGFSLGSFPQRKPEQL